MSRDAWSLLCDVIEQPHKQYAQYVDRYVVQELADRSLVVVTPSLHGLSPIRATNHGVLEYQVIN